jgi:glycogen phosphorylase
LSASSVDVSAIEDSVRRHATYSLGKAWRDLSQTDLLNAVALSVRDRLVERMLETEERYLREDPKRINYLSIEFLMGQSLGNHIHNLGIRELCRQALGNLGANLEALEDSEKDAALGNGGLGRLAACFMDSLATLGMPACRLPAGEAGKLARAEKSLGDRAAGRGLFCACLRPHRTLHRPQRRL